MCSWTVAGGERAQNNSVWMCVCVCGCGCKETTKLKRSGRAQARGLSDGAKTKYVVLCFCEPSQLYDMSNLQRLDRAEDRRAWARERASSSIANSRPYAIVPSTHPAACIYAACAMRHLHIAARVQSQTCSIRPFHSPWPIPWSVSLDGSDMMAQRHNHRPSWWNPLANSSTPNLTSFFAIPIRSPHTAPSVSLASIPIVDSPYKPPPTTRPLAPSSITAKTWNPAQTRSTCATMPEIKSQPLIGCHVQSMPIALDLTPGHMLTPSLVCSLRHLFPMRTSPIPILLVG